MSRKRSRRDFMWWWRTGNHDFDIVTEFCTVCRMSRAAYVESRKSCSDVRYLHTGGVLSPAATRLSCRGLATPALRKLGARLEQLRERVE